MCICTVFRLSLKAFSATVMVLSEASNVTNNYSMIGKLENPADLLCPLADFLGRSCKQCSDLFAKGDLTTHTPTVQCPLFAKTPNRNQLRSATYSSAVTNGILGRCSERARRWAAFSLVLQAKFINGAKGARTTHSK